MELVKLIETVARILMPRDPCHGYEHVERVRRLALRIAKKLAEQGYEIDFEALEIAALLHDVGRSVSEEKHAEVSADIARRILEALGIDRDRIEKIARIILAHSYSYGRKPESLEEAILSDADKLDAMGAVGIARVFIYSGKHGRSIEDSIKHIETKILRLKDLVMTEPAKKLAEDRHRFVEQFLAQLKKELDEVMLR